LNTFFFAAMNFDDDHQLAMQIAADAGRLLVALKGNSILANRMLGDVADAVAQQFIERSLRCHRPADAILSEEAPPDLRRLGCRRVWIVDPLDGTREYSEPGDRTDWAVHVALCTDGMPTAGAVALPAQGITYHTGNATRPVIGMEKALRIVVSRTRPTAFAARVAASIGAELITMGSAGAKAMAVVRGDADAYLATGEMAEWDSAAPVAVSTAAGLHVSRIDGTPLAFNQAVPRTPDLLICRPDLAAMLLAAITTARGQP
jgi:3'(2'), 5'-bisphosphate nucleotidase